MRHHGFEPGTPWLRVRCSTNWANSAYFTWQRSTLPHGYPCSTIDAVELNCPVRNGKECFLYAIITRCYGFLNLWFSQNLVLLSLLSEFPFRDIVISKLHMNYIFYWSSPRPISISQLNTLPHLHLWPINLVVFKGSY